MNKLRRIWNAFCRGFWAAWLEVPPSADRKLGDLTVNICCDTSNFDDGIERVMQRLRSAQQVASR